MQLTRSRVSAGAINNYDWIRRESCDTLQTPTDYTPPVRARKKQIRTISTRTTDSKKHTSKQFVQFAAPLINPITFDIDFEWLSLAGAAASTRSNHAGTIARTTEKPINRVRVRASFWHMSRQACRTCATGPISASVDSRCTPVECYRQADNRCHHLHANALPSLSRSLARSLFLSVSMSVSISQQFVLAYRRPQREP